jgi:hypothetical protein
MSEYPELHSLSLPDQKNYEISYGLAYNMAVEKLSGIENLEAQCRKSESICQINGFERAVLVKYLNHSYRITVPGITISREGGDGQIELRDKILILHYLTRATGRPLSSQLIAYQELQEGSAYYPTFIKRAVKPLIDHFGQTPEKLLEVSREIGGFLANLGDFAVTIPAFSRVPLTLVIWKGDDEFPPNANILFDNTILEYLPVEDINVLCQTVSWQLVKSLSGKTKTGTV